jgi:hypothetical protein
MSMTSTDLSARSETSPWSRRAGVAHETRTGDVVFGAGLASLAVFAAWCGRGVWFFIDEWSVVTRYHDGHWLEPFNGHLSLVPIAIYRTLLSTVGYDFVWFRLVALLCYGAVAVAVYRFARERVDPLPAAIAGLAVAWSSQARLMIMFPLLLNFAVPMAAVVAIWILLDRDRPQTDVAASVLTGVALASSAVGLLAPIAVGADLVLRREARVRRWITFLPPVALWLAWYVTKAQGHTGAGGSPSKMVSFAWREFYATFGGLAGGWEPGGIALLVATGALVAVAALRWKTFDRRALAITLTLLGFLVLTGAGRSNAGQKFHVPPIAADSDRYLWVNAILLICLTVHLLRGRRLPAVAIIAAAGLTIVNGAVLTDRLYHYRDTPVSNAAGIRSYLVAVDAVGDKVDRSRPMPMGFIPVSTAEYLGLARHYGSPVAGISLDALGNEESRVGADGWIVHDLGIRVHVGGGSTQPACAALDAAGPDGATVKAPASVVIRATDEPVMVLVRRLATRFDAPPIGEVPAGATGVVDLSLDHSGAPWHLHVLGTGADVRRCG